MDGKAESRSSRQSIEGSGEIGAVCSSANQAGEYGSTVEKPWNFGVQGFTDRENKP